MAFEHVGFKISEGAFCNIFQLAAILVEIVGWPALWFRFKVPHGPLHYSIGVGRALLESRPAKDVADETSVG